MPGSRRSRTARALAAAVAVLALGGCGIGDNSTVVPPPTAEQSTETVEVLKRSAAEHGICYGWVLVGNGTSISVGSNLGEGIAVSGSPVCPRWVQVTAQVRYTPASSELEDSASILIESHDDLLYESWLRQFDIDEKVFIDDPGWAVTRTATLLPLLAVENGYATPAPVSAQEPVEPATAPSNLPSAGSDFVRDRWGYLLAVFVVLALAGGLVAVGFWQRSVQKRAAAQGPRRPANGPRRPAGPPSQPSYPRR